jgi:hypothetical protein
MPITPAAKKNATLKDATLWVANVAFILYLKINCFLVFKSKHMKIPKLEYK